MIVAIMLGSAIRGITITISRRNTRKFKDPSTDQDIPARCHSKCWINNNEKPLSMISAGHALLRGVTQIQGDHEEELQIEVGD